MPFVTAQKASVFICHRVIWQIKYNTWVSFNPQSHASWTKTWLCLDNTSTTEAFNGHNTLYKWVSLRDKVMTLKLQWTCIELTLVLQWLWPQGLLHKHTSWFSNIQWLSLSHPPQINILLTSCWVKRCTRWIHKWLLMFLKFWLQIACSTNLWQNLH